MAEAVYVLSAMTSVACAVMLLKSYRASAMPLLFWSGLCFVFFAANNLFLLADLIFTPELDFSVPRNLCGVLGTTLLLYGVLWSPRRRPKV